MTKEEIISALEEIRHPAIDYSLTRLGILRDIRVEEGVVSVVFAFPFPNIPIADTLINSVSDVVRAEGLDFKYETRVMTDEERAAFIQLENEGWKGQ